MASRPSNTSSVDDALDLFRARLQTLLVARQTKRVGAERELVAQAYVALTELKHPPKLRIVKRRRSPRSPHAWVFFVRCAKCGTRRAFSPECLDKAWSMPCVCSPTNTTEETTK